MAEPDAKRDSTNFISEMRRRGYAVEQVEGINFGLLHVFEADGDTVADEVEQQQPDVLVLESGGYTRRFARQIENFMHNRIPLDDKRYQEVFKNPFLLGVVKGLRRLVAEGKKVPVVVFTDIRHGSEYQIFTPKYQGHISASLDAVKGKLSFVAAKRLLEERTTAYVAADQMREKNIVTRLPDAIVFGRRGQHLVSQKNLKVMFAYGANHMSLTKLATDFGIPTRQSWQHPEMPRDHLSQYAGVFRNGNKASEELAEKALLFSIIERALPNFPGIQQITFASLDHLKRFLLVVVDSFSPQERQEIYDAAVAGSEIAAIQKAMAGKSYTFKPPLRRGQKPPFQIVVHIPPPGTIIDLTKQKLKDQEK